MSAQDDIGPSGRLRNMSAWRIHALAAEIKGLAGNAVAHARIRDPDNVMVARNALEKIRRLLAEDGDE